MAQRVADIYDVTVRVCDLFDQLAVVLGVYVCMLSAGGAGEFVSV